MSTDRLPAYDAADPSAYVDAMLALVGDRDPLKLLETGPDRIRRSVEGLSEADARTPEPAQARGGDREGWSVLHTLRHLADSEIVYGYRIRLIIADETPAIPGYDQDAWADRLAYDRGTVVECVEDYAAGRRMTLRLLRALPEADWDRYGLHSERGQESVRRIATLLAGHDLNHERQIARTRAALGV